VKFITIILALIAGNFISCHSQSSATEHKKMRASAVSFLKTLSSKQKEKAQFAFTDEERYNWHFVPKPRKGIQLKELDDKQLRAAYNLLHTGLSDSGFNKTTSIIQLENILRVVENRAPEDDYRDPGKYYFSIFGDPVKDSIWGWRLEGHHISFNFSSENNKIVSGTPSFLGSNPAIVLSGLEKGKYILKDEAELALAMLNALDAEQKNTAIIQSTAPADIITANARKAMINDTKGISYGQLNSSQQKIFLQLLSIYIYRYTRLFAMQMMKDIETAGLANLRFAWAGDQQTGVGHPHYYRIQGPTIIIEYDNTQNNANHIHTVIRDLKNDFGGDELLEHYHNIRH
jgi:hypothetical protein